MISVNLGNKKNQELIIDFLSQKYEVVGNKLTERTDIDIIICDVEMFYKNRENILSVKKESEIYIPLILLIGSKSSKTLEKAVVEEIDYTLEIPVSKEKMLATVEKSLNTKEAFQNIHHQYEYLSAENKLGIFIQNENGLIFINEKLKELIPDIKVHAFIEETVLPEYKEQLKDYLNYVFSKPDESLREYIEVKLDKSEECWLLIIASSTLYKQSQAVRGVVLDITSKKNAERKLNEAFEELKLSYERSIRLINNIVERRDPYTASHQRKVRELSLQIAKELKLNEEKIEVVDKASILHDIGKIFIPSEILNKPGKLTGFEMKMIKQHPEHSYELIMEANLNLYMAKTVLQHHERLDGSGYPQGLMGDDIYYEAKILAVADVVEAMSSHRPYRPSLGLEAALKEIQDNASKLYDP
ncbi:MAG: HD domain-containing protein, partial [Kosmotogaceae bacterium]